MTEMHDRPTTELLRSLLGAPGPELSCEQCFDQLDRYVELELSGARADEVIPGMRAHLAGCSSCDEEHLSLRALIVSDA